jgi:hypothetical protein
MKGIMSQPGKLKLESCGKMPAMPKMGKGESRAVGFPIGGKGMKMPKMGGKR